MPDPYTGFWAAVGGAGFVLMGWVLGGAKAGTAAAVFALIMTMHGLRQFEGIRARNVQQATAEVADLEMTINDIVEQEVFTQVEEDTGEGEEDILRRNS